LGFKICPGGDLERRQAVPSYCGKEEKTQLQYITIGLADARKKEGKAQIEVDSNGLFGKDKQQGRIKGKRGGAEGKYLMLDTGRQEKNRENGTGTTHLRRNVPVPVFLRLPLRIHSRTNTLFGKKGWHTKRRAPGAYALGDGKTRHSCSGLCSIVREA
jgi:hypothetical protein